MHDVGSVNVVIDDILSINDITMLLSLYLPMDSLSMGSLSFKK